MDRLLHRLAQVVGTAALALALAACPSSQLSRPMPETEARAVRDTILALEVAMNTAVDHLDCAGGLGYIGDHRPLFVSTGHVVRTHDALLRMCGAMVAPRTGATFVTDSVAAFTLGPDAAYVVREGDYTIRFRDGRTVTKRLVMTTIWERQDGQWRMVHLHESSPSESTPAQVAAPTPAH